MLVKWAAIWESGMRGGLEARLRRFDGEYRWFLFQAVPLRDKSGNIVKWYGSSTDIEDRKRAEEALRESGQRFRDYAETASDWFWEHGPDHRFTRISEHVSDIGFVPPGLSRWDIATDTESEPEKMATASGGARRPSAISRFRVHLKWDWIPSICPNERQANSRRKRQFSRLSGHRNQYYGEDPR